jgi:tetratricopeptide (TPR) repeat protein
VLVSWAATLGLSYGRWQEALDHAREALAIAEQLGLVPLQVAALSRAGSALMSLGRGGSAELERAIELGRDGAAPHEIQAAFGNLAAVLTGEGRLRDAARLFSEGLAEAKRFGLRADIQFHSAQLASSTFMIGDWARSDDLFEEYLTLIAASPGHHLSTVVTNTRATIGRARGDLDNALAHAERSLDIGRSSKQFQGLGRGLSVLALVLVEQGRHDEATPLVDELLTFTAEDGRAFWWRWLIDLGWLLLDLGRPEPLPWFPAPAWNDPGQAIARGDLTTAVELLAATDLVTETAYARLRAGEHLAARGRYDEAQSHLDHAAAFYRSVGGAAYLERALVAGRAKAQN